jgi:hypothetical protein
MKIIEIMREYIRTHGRNIQAVKLTTEEAVSICDDFAELERQLAGANEASKNHPKELQNSQLSHENAYLKDHIANVCAFSLTLEKENIALQKKLELSEKSELSRLYMELQESHEKLRKDNIIKAGKIHSKDENHRALQSKYLDKCLENNKLKKDAEKYKQEIIRLNLALYEFSGIKQEEFGGFKKVFLRKSKYGSWHELDETTWNTLNHKLYAFDSRVLYQKI